MATKTARSDGRENGKLMKIITIDGLSYTGKSTMADQLGILLDFKVIHTGEFYRYEAVARLTDRFIPEYDSIEVIKLASELAKDQSIRSKITNLIRQQVVSAQINIILEGRDCGSNIFTLADYKIFITASEEVRLKRMNKMTGAENTIADLRQLDINDITREHNPTICPEGAIHYDNTDSPSADNDAENILKIITLILMEQLIHA